jgi:hypothetical protein
MYSIQTAALFPPFAKVWFLNFPADAYPCGVQQILYFLGWTVAVLSEEDAMRSWPSAGSSGSNFMMTSF